jgi:uncharacterized protein YndB with AHSA1/START domain
MLTIFSRLLFVTTIGGAAMKRPETKSISIQAPPERVLEFVGDARNLPRWAPAFAPSIRADGDAWIVGSDDDGRRITVRVSREHGTVDFLAAAAPQVGAFSRVVPNDAGSEYFFTLFFGPEASPSAVAQQMAVVDEELRTVRELCEIAAGS